jgi:3-hydroxybutyryl-CoA dehydrogenase
MFKIGVLGAGSMGSGIAQVASQCGHEVVLCDTNATQLEKAQSGLAKTLEKLVEKEKITTADSQAIQKRIQYANSISEFEKCDLIIEAIIENLEIKKTVFSQLESIVSETCILASNTSSLSIASIAAACKKPERVIGIHFFNPAPLMPLVEIIPAVQTSEATTRTSRDLVDSWKKVTVLTKDTPGFIVNRVARPFYGEALRIYEEGIADFATIDWAMTELGGFKMGPFTLMDYIGNDVNYAVTESVFASFYFDPKFKPSLTQKRHSEAGWFGRKSGRGYYDYSKDAVQPEPVKDLKIAAQIFNRILVMLINEAADAVFLNIASVKDVDLAMTKGVNYPKGLLQWANELGLQNVLKQLDALYDEYREDRYRASVLLRRKAQAGQLF